MTISVLLVILYRASFWFARGAEKKTLIKRGCSVAERDAGILVTGNRCCRGKRNYIVNRVEGK